MTQADVALFNDSLERCTANPSFLPRFYQLFVGSSPEAREKLARTDMAKQARLLRASLYLVMLAAEDRPEGTVHLDRLAELHSRRGLDVRPELYDLWLDCLVKTVREFDSQFTADTERVWRGMMKRGIECMKSTY